VHPNKNDAADAVIGDELDRGASGELRAVPLRFLRLTWFAQLFRQRHSGRAVLDLRAQLAYGQVLCHRGLCRRSDAAFCVCGEVSSFSSSPQKRSLGVQPHRDIAKEWPA
jgi:hypothetical protein